MLIPFPAVLPLATQAIDALSLKQQQAMLIIVHLLQHEPSITNLLANASIRRLLPLSDSTNSLKSEHSSTDATCNLSWGHVEI